MLTRTIPAPAKALGLITYMLVELLFSDSGASMHLAKISSQTTAHPKSGVFNELSANHIVILWPWAESKGTHG